MSVRRRADGLPVLEVGTMLKTVRIAKWARRPTVGEMWISPGGDKGVVERIDEIANHGGWRITMRVYNI